MDARTGLGRFRDFRISNYDLMMELIDYCRKHSIEQIMQLPDVKERSDLYFEHEEKLSKLCPLTPNGLSGFRCLATRLKILKKFYNTYFNFPRSPPKNFLPTLPKP